jgi:HSP20 family protein
MILDYIEGMLYLATLEGFQKEVYAMFGLTRLSPFEDVFNFQREVDRLFNQFWSDLPTRTAATAAGSSPSFQVITTDEGWRIDVPMPGIDPKDVTLEVAGKTLSIHAEAPSDENDKNPTRYEQTFTVPEFLDLEKLTASHRHGMLRLTVPLKESVKPRRIQIETEVEDQKRLVGAR